ncbi:hypothetical protein SDC9_150326 [bioreactor metagenome]|uniref:Uncharacterized protein n=1 Tax=bioreactor metagenome TaxID=1076179 RepID=A0A645ERE7_9ZZZZ
MIHHPARRDEQYKREKKIGDRPGQRGYRHAGLRVFEIAHVHRNRLCPAESGYKHHYKAYRVDMANRVERQPVLLLGRRVSERVGRETVARLVHG